jgi:hypothetical protein
MAVLRQELPVTGLWPRAGLNSAGSARVDPATKVSTTGTSGNQAQRHRARNGVNELQRKQSDTNKREGKSTKLVDILPLITVWLQVRVLPGPPVISAGCQILVLSSADHCTRNAHFCYLFAQLSGRQCNAARSI